MKCFVIMPFGNPQIDVAHAARLESIYSKWIKVAVESITIPGSQNEKITCHRADKTFKPGEIIAHVVENLLSAEIVIADLSGRNPNVFYELGVRHAIGNNCILISDNLDDVPFDLRPLRTIIYKYEPDAMLMLQDALKRAILEILPDLNTIDNPVRRFVYQRELDRATLDSDSRESALVKSVISEMASLRKEFTQQSVEVRKIMKLVTSSSDSTMTLSAESGFDIKSFEGVWRDRISQSVFYVREKNGELIVPYSYGGQRSLIGHVYNSKFIDKTLLGRFEWFHSPISGYMFLRIEGDGRIEGGWWYEGDVPKEFTKDVAKVSESLPGMNRLSLERSTESTKFPTYIEQYFSKREQYFSQRLEKKLRIW